MGHSIHIRFKCHKQWHFFHFPRETTLQSNRCNYREISLNIHLYHHILTSFHSRTRSNTLSYCTFFYITSLHPWCLYISNIRRWISWLCWSNINTFLRSQHLAPSIFFALLVNSFPIAYIFPNEPLCSRCGVKQSDIFREYHLPVTWCDVPIHTEQYYFVVMLHSKFILDLPIYTQYAFIYIASLVFEGLYLSHWIFGSFD